ncbi:hypothetical protein LZ554_006447 [Drepanopeziza brunnea f. sp. 'monogermtubi']|nr:hypothetical protein LZ554_006447 [Drepanopeziza brunnea f. sp. 'monogermtubi']
MSPMEISFTPRPTTAPTAQAQAQAQAQGQAQGQAQLQAPATIGDRDEATTPTRTNFGGLTNDGSSTSPRKSGIPKRFDCVGYQDCHMSFTRSEHLLRHIRKHTGERPFVCFCSHRFTRYDNLRQHLQTVHKNEYIPPDYMTAAGSRGLRQDRTDRVRSSQGRPRASATISQPSRQPGPVPGHKRNALSMSSIPNMGSSGWSREPYPRRHPAPLIVPGDQNRYSQEYQPDSPSGEYSRYNPYARPASSGLGTPTSATSATFSTGQNSPRWSQGVQSPVAVHPRPLSYAGNPFQSPLGGSYGLNSPSTPAGGMISSPSAATSGGSRRESMTHPMDAEPRRRTWHPDSRPAVENYTSRLQNLMNPSTPKHATGQGPLPQLEINSSRLQSVTNASNHYATGHGPLPQPPTVPSQPMRLPGIASLVSMRRPGSPDHRQPSPRMFELPIRAPVRQEYSQEGKVGQFWDQGTNNRHLDRLEFAQGSPADAATQWAAETNRAMQSAREPSSYQPSAHFEGQYYATPRTGGGYPRHYVSAPVQPVTSTAAKRKGWYDGPPTSMPPTRPVQRTSPTESSGSEGGNPGTPSGMGEHNPDIVHSSGWVESRNGRQQHTPIVPSNGYPAYHSQGAEGAYTYGPRPYENPVEQHREHVPKSRDMAGLDALAAVATAEGDAKREMSPTMAY